MLKITPKTKEQKLCFVFYNIQSQIAISKHIHYHAIMYHRIQITKHWKIILKIWKIVPKLVINDQDISSRTMVFGSDNNRVLASVLEVVKKKRKIYIFSHICGILCIFANMWACCRMWWIDCMYVMPRVARYSAILAPRGVARDCKCVSQFILQCNRAWMLSEGRRTAVSKLMVCEMRVGWYVEGVWRKA